MFWQVPAIEEGKNEMLVALKTLEAVLVYF
jgi:hypothetical protein